jgi:hypothetical protein
LLIKGHNIDPIALGSSFSEDAFPQERAKL